MATVNLKFIKSPSCKPFKLGYSIGDIASFEAKQANELINSGFARVVGKENSNLPLDIPFRERLMSHDILSIEELLNVFSIKELEGIDEKMEKTLYIYLYNKGIVSNSPEAKAEEEAKAKAEEEAKAKAKAKAK